MTEIRLKHQTISEALAKEIRDGIRPPGERLPGEHALAREFGVSRTTMRAALAELSDAGLIATRTGKGSFVLFDGRRLNNPLGWARALADQGVETVVRTLFVREVHDEDLARSLGIETTRFILVERTRELAASGTIVSYERSRLPSLPVIRGLTNRGPAELSLTAIMRDAGLEPHHGEQRLRGRRIDAEEARVLRREPGDWFLETSRTSRAADESFVEHVVSLLDPEHFQLSVEFS
ncbi:GntR family transcriptional regulator [Actinospica sp.]|jgi:GntR family transcriptional regulator|uniref:GntR family transcriptional regulator n=1 Tax=Actinospica sp. TaxID=1872142 RepID=UPI002C84802F|nr:GntR family transcriptional regulator [Actinospica sp.]HWG24140.1 GntR family transcriptional regulator [Actinospica sp.]